MTELKRAQQEWNEKWQEYFKNVRLETFFVSEGLKKFFDGLEFVGGSIRDIWYYIHVKSNHHHYKIQGSHGNNKARYAKVMKHEKFSVTTSFLPDESQDEEFLEDTLLGFPLYELAKAFHEANKDDTIHRLRQALNGIEIDDVVSKGH